MVALVVEIAGEAAFTVVDVIAGVSVITREALLPHLKRRSLQIILILLN